jgi:hypothetical protein
MIVNSFLLTVQKLRDLRAILRRGGLSHKDCEVAVWAVKRWLPSHSEAPENTPSHLVVPEDIPNPQEHNHVAET